MADDIITLGGPERGGPERGGPGRGGPGRGGPERGGPARGARSARGADADGAMESLFHAHYPRLVQMAFLHVGDWDLAEQLAQEAYLRLWRRWRSNSDPLGGPAYLERTVLNLSRETLGRRGAEPEQERPVQEMGRTVTVAAAARRTVDADLGWRAVRLRGARARRNRRARVNAAAAVVAATAIAIVALAVTSGRVVRVPGSAGASGGGRSPRSYPGAVVARIPVSGVVDLVQDGTQVWAVRGAGQPGAPTYQLVRIDMARDQVTLRVNLGPVVSVVAAGHGSVWLTTAGQRAAGQVVRIDPVTGRVIATLHLPAGRCGYVTFSGGRLWAECGAGRSASVLLAINATTGQVDERIGPLDGPIGQVALVPRGAWYLTDSGISGLIGPVGLMRGSTVRDPAYPVSFAYTQSLVYSEGSLWALTNDESVARIDPSTGRVVRVYGYERYDPVYRGGLDFLAVGQGSLWFLDHGYPFSGVLRVSIATGRPLGEVTIRPGTCGNPCWQIYATRGAVWVPTERQLIRIDPRRLPG